MEQQRRNYVQDLKAWDLLRLEELEIKLVDELVAAKPRVTYFDRKHLGAVHLEKTIRFSKQSSLLFLRMLSL